VYDRATRIEQSTSRFVELPRPERMRHRDGFEIRIYGELTN